MKNWTASCNTRRIVCVCVHTKYSAVVVWLISRCFRRITEIVVLFSRLAPDTTVVFLIFFFSFSLLNSFSFPSEKKTTYTHSQSFGWQQSIKNKDQVQISSRERRRQWSTLHHISTLFAALLPRGKVKKRSSNLVLCLHVNTEHGFDFNLAPNWTRTAATQ